MQKSDWDSSLQDKRERNESRGWKTSVKRCERTASIRANAFREKGTRVDGI